MKVIVCIDDNMGILFGKKRVSKDSKIIDDIELINDVISMSEYSSTMFKKTVNISDKLECGYNFVENNSLENMEDQVSEITVYFFNRRYPSTLKLKLDLSKFDLISECEFKGSGHDKITKKVYGSK